MKTALDADRAGADAVEVAAQDVVEAPQQVAAVDVAMERRETEVILEPCRNRSTTKTETPTMMRTLRI
jgi:hypothetical protein